MAMHDAAPYLPHGAAMCLIDQVGDDGSAYAVIRPDNPFLQRAGLPAWVALEYMAQAAAAAHNLRAARGGAARPGVITAFKALRYGAEWLDPVLALSMSTELIHADGGHAVTRCQLWQGAPGGARAAPDAPPDAPLATVTLYTKEIDAERAP